jgi:molybdate transport system substrate-binding protein
MLRFCLALFLGSATAQADDKVTIAVAANLVHTIDALTSAFQAEQPNVKVEVTIGSSGNLVAQITHGAPFDLFLSADLEYPQALIDSGAADATNLTPFATGRLVLWTTRANIQFPDVATALRDTRVHEIAVAHMTTAPYGRAAKQTLEKLNLWEELQSQIVVGENISQTAQFVASGNADLGFVALSLVLSPQLEGKGTWIEVPAHLHAPLTQGAVLTNRGARNNNARSFLTFLQSAEARKVFARYGYAVPTSP